MEPSNAHIIENPQRKKKLGCKKIAASQVTEIVNNLVEEKKKKEQKYDFTRVMTKYFVLVVDF